MSDPKPARQTEQYCTGQRKEALRPTAMVDTLHVLQTRTRSFGRGLWKTKEPSTQHEHAKQIT